MTIAIITRDIRLIRRQISVNKSDMEMDIIGHIKEVAITFEDLDGFSEELVERVKSLYNTFVG